MFKLSKKSVPLETIPNHLAIIMDGNGRWAQKRGLPRIAGHRKGITQIGEVIKYCQSIGIKELTLFAFSTENWQRQPEEVNFLMDQALNYYHKHNYKLAQYPYLIKIVGETSNLSLELKLAVEDLNRQFNDELLTKASRLNQHILKVNFAFNYGSKQEILNAIKTIASLSNQSKLNLEQLKIDEINNYLYVNNNVDYLIRTSGEERISNFLLWQIGYAEIKFVKDYWPDFDQKALHLALLDYQKRERRFGK